MNNEKHVLFSIFFQFTDNGQIIFPAFNSEIRKYTNPFAEGFKTSSKPAMLAAFWDDADLSSGGNIYYQEYSTISRSNSIVKDIESKIQTNLKVTYTAKWTLKITWENIPAYPADMFKDKTNTFQAIITTDGVEAYAMMLYKDKGMNWDTDRLTTTDVLMGYNSADGFFLNDRQMSKTPKDKYRPDRFIGANSNIRGLWIYKLTKGTFKENFKVKCLEWVELEPEVSTWASDTADCPCSLQQGRQDGRYRRAGRDGDFTVLRSVSSASRQGARCLYNKKGSFYNGWIERYPKKITGSSQAEDLDTLPYTWCCKDTEDPKFCDYYQTKRPQRDCSSYRAPSSGLMSGDPHISSFDDLRYTFNGLGDFILVNAQDSDSSFTLQARTVITPNSKATNFNDFAAQYKENGTTNTVLWILKGTDSIDVIVNNKLISEFTTVLDSGEFYEADEILLERSSGNTVSATFSGILSIKVTASFSLMNAVINLPSKYKSKTEGLLGKWNGDQSDDLKKRNGDTIPPSSTESEIYAFGLTWDAGQESLFPSKNRSIQSKTADTSFKPVFLEDLKMLDGYAKVEAACGNDVNCIFDGMSTGNLTIGLATKQTLTSFAESKKALESFPPNITGIKQFTANIGETVTETYTAKTSDGSQVKFTPITLANVNLTESGILTWTPTSVKPLTVTIEAVGENNMTAILQPVFVVCDCGTNGECIYGDITRVGDSALYETSCKCHDGYTGKNCRTKQSICETVSCYPGVVCNETTGCAQCPAGKEGNGIQCSDINHCLSNPCPSTASCTSIKDSFTCNCKEGYKGDGKNCTDNDECKNSPCIQNATCTNTEGSYTCTCKAGYSGDGKTSCTDVDECKTSSPCSPNANCTNEIGSYKCVCKQGFNGDGKTSCTDVDECKTSSPCSPNANCTNEIGSYKCVCKQGFNGDGKNCTDNDECKNSPCTQNTMCTNTEGSYTCTCKPGYTGDGKNCTDNDECKNSPCTQNTMCTNTEGSYTCTCKPGYTGDGKTSCTDVDECKTSSPCSPNANCTNEIGSYKCVCKQGFQGDGQFCSDINECLNSPSCSPYADCANSVGSYKCTCKHGYTGDGKLCNNSCGDCPADFCSNGGSCTQIPADGCKATCTCPSPYTGEQCGVAGATFEPKPLASAPKRSLKLTLKLKGDYNQQAISDIKSPEYVSLVKQIDTKVAQRMLTLTVKTFAKNQDITLKVVNNQVAAEFLSLFDYGVSITDIDFLNNKLQDAIIDVLNVKVQRRRREDTVQFEPVTKADITDVNRATAEELSQHMNCASKGIKGYSAVFDPKIGFLCVSPCLTNDYCKNGGTCQHYVEGPMCKCVLFTMYTPYGENCEYLAMNLRAFFGILFGTLAFIFVVVVLLSLLFYCYCRQMCCSPNLSESKGPNFYWGDGPFRSLNRMNEDSLKSPDNQPKLVQWKSKP
ncbi:mucin-4-like [Acipenser oxyrinchus oxyrinchus]|uniref:Mucin-4-like n=1 Tax=Acipenser oxyrinchus oxyrinchus TaxID=40147 RepID=A0AAD8D311_ACIOX|nr:mucin-4-like [Acipenser oxyrinchus oxyrinchus]